MHGHIDTEDPRSLVVTDVFPIPVEGTETSVMTDNPAVTNYMIQLSETLEAVLASFDLAAAPLLEMPAAGDLG
jgi:hypothetical protein